MKKILLTSAFLLFISYFSFAQVKTRSYLVDPKLAPREHNVDFKHMRLEVFFDAAKGLVKGKVTHRFSPLQPKVDSIVLDAVNIRVKELTLNGKPVNWRGAEIVIRSLPAVLSMPRPGPGTTP